MRYIEFGTAKAKVSEVILGCMRIGGKTGQEAVAIIESALEADINAVDTAPIYGPSEGIIGDAFELQPGLRDRVWLQTKLGIRHNDEPSFNYFDFSYEHIMESVDNSLRALKTDHVDSLLLHRPDLLMIPEDIARAFEELRASGKVLDFGVSNQNPAQVAMIQHYLPFPLAANQVQLSCAFTPAFDAAFHVNMEDSAATMRDGGVFEDAYVRGMAVQAWSVMQKGYFGGVFLGDPEYQELNDALARVAEVHNSTPTAVAIAWVLRHPAKMQAIIGTMRPERIAESARACDFELTREEWYEIYLAGGRQLP